MMSALLGTLALMAATMQWEPITAPAPEALPYLPMEEPVKVWTPTDLPDAMSLACI